MKVFKTFGKTILIAAGAAAVYLLIDRLVDLSGTLRNVYIFLFFLAPNYYVGSRGWRYIGRHIKGLNRILYWVLFWLIAESYIIGKIINKLTQTSVGEPLVTFNWYWSYLLGYFICILVIVDLIRLLDRKFKFLPDGIINSRKFSLSVAGIAIAVMIIALAYGTWHAQQPVVKNYEISMDKKAGKLDKLHIVQLSDVHLSKIFTVERLNKVVAAVNGLQPDIVVFTGDTIEDEYKYVLEKNMMAVLKGVKSKYGSYAILGNHEYYRGYAQKNIENLKSAGMHVLFDSYAKIDDSFYLVGRDDRGFGRKTRKELSEFTKGIDFSLPVILLDHWPTDYKEAMDQGMDLQLSGHTHNGQFFPGQLTNKLSYEYDYGYMKKGNFQMIVSAGVGTFGLPARLGSNAEIVDIKINFKGN